MTHYDVLNVAASASTEEIKQSFKVLAKKYHPDLNKEDNAKENFILVYEAYSILSDRKRKQVYDEILSRNETEKNERRYDQWASRARNEAEYYSEESYSTFETLFEKIGWSILFSISSMLRFKAGKILFAILFFFPILILFIVKKLKKKAVKESVKKIPAASREASSLVEEIYILARAIPRLQRNKHY